MQSTQKEKLNFLIKTLIYNGDIKNVADFADTIGYSRSTLSGILSGKKDLSIPIANKVCKTYGNDWLRFEKDEVLKNKPAESEKENNACGYMVPVYNFDAVGGMNTSNDVIDAQAYIEKYVPFENARSGDIGVKVTGNSMIPTYSPGSLLLVRRVEAWQEYFGYGHTFVLFLRDGRRILKEVRRYDQDPKNYILCVSHNDSHQIEELPKSLIVDVYKVILSQTYEGF